MKLPFFKKREAKELLIACRTEIFHVSKSGRIDLSYCASVGYSDGSRSRPLSGGISLSRQQVLEMYALVAPRPRKKRSQCKNGHPKDAENTIIVGGQSRCRICYIDYGEKQKAERKSGKQ